MKRSAVVLLLIIIASTAFIGCRVPANVVRKVDHVAISSEDPAALFKVFSETLGLPVAWQYMDYPGYSTGGVQAGNVNIESLHFGEPANTADPGAMLFGIVLEPYPLEQSVPELKARGAEPGKEEPQTMEVNGQQVTLWTNVTLKALCGPEYIVYLCEYGEEAAKRLEEGKKEGPLGTLGVMSVEKIVITSTRTDELQKTWSRVMAPNSVDGKGMIMIGDGPAIQIKEGKKDAIESLVIKVKSLSKAKSALEKAGMLGKASNDQLTIDPARVQGLDIVLVQN